MGGDELLDKCPQDPAAQKNSIKFYIFGVTKHHCSFSKTFSLEEKSLLFFWASDGQKRIMNLTLLFLHKTNPH